MEVIKFLIKSYSDALTTGHLPTAMFTQVHFSFNSRKKEVNGMQDYAGNFYF